MKKSIYVLSLISFIAFSCHKEKDELLVVGSTKNLIITSHNLSVKGDNLSCLSKEKILIDLDLDGQMDIEFISIKDSLAPQLCGQYTEEEMESFNIEEEKGIMFSNQIKMINNNFRLAFEASSNVRYTRQSPFYEIDGPNGKIEVTETFYMTCKPSEEAEALAVPHTVLSFKYGEIIHGTQKFVFEDHLNMRCNSYSSTLFYDDPNIEKRLGNKVNFENDCYQVPTNEKRYLVFKNLDRWGWISFEITEENRITIFETAISEKK